MLYRCVDALVLGNEDANFVPSSDLRFIEGKAYDDKKKEVAAAIKRFPDHFEPADAK